MSHPQARAGTGTKLNSKIGKSHPKSQAAQVKEATTSTPNAIDEEGVVCIRRLDKGIGHNPTQRDADQRFLKTHFGEISQAEMHSLFASSPGAILHALMRRRIEREEKKS